MSMTHLTSPSLFEDMDASVSCILTDARLLRLVVVLITVHQPLLFININTGSTSHGVTVFKDFKLLISVVFLSITLSLHIDLSSSYFHISHSPGRHWYYWAHSVEISPPVLRRIDFTNSNYQYWLGQYVVVQEHTALGQSFQQTLVSDQTWFADLLTLVGCTTACCLTLQWHC